MMEPRKEDSNVVKVGQLDERMKSWHHPEISRIDIKRTLSGSSPGMDGNGQSS